MKKILINLSLFQTGWLVCVLGGDLYAVVFTLGALLLHHWLVLDDPREWKLIGAVVLGGCLWDTAMAQSGVIRYADALIAGIPLWLVCLWFLFATRGQQFDGADDQDGSNRQVDREQPVP